MPAMTEEHLRAFRAIFANGIGFEPGDLQSVNEADLMLLGMQFYNQGVGRALDQLKSSLEIGMVWEQAEWVGDRIEEVRKETLLRSEDHPWDSAKKRFGLLKEIKDFQAGQWWVTEIEGLLMRHDRTDNQYRVVHGVLRRLLKLIEQL